MTMIFRTCVTALLLCVAAPATGYSAVPVDLETREVEVRPNSDQSSVLLARITAPFNAAASGKPPKDQPYPRIKPPRSGPAPIQGGAGTTTVTLPPPTSAPARGSSKWEKKTLTPTFQRAHDGHAIPPRSSSSGTPPRDKRLTPIFNHSARQF